MELQEMLDKIKAGSNYHKVGMILCHNGVVRGFSRSGETVSAVKVQADHKKLNELIERAKSRSGIVEVLVEINEGVLKVGEDIMRVCVAGDIRPNVFPALEELVNGIKSEVLKKEEEIS
ncbi:molybdenum cofactor biosynthesis protein MoaE [Candidatus Oleimmundimicrobium sp.]|uniref:molybdenum cofactor biosynthesis protein MoaE n=1 Tax=Candidatus Oleimmundimicrobium sp. TaxID=3060597 RepID=UPI002728B217|nr:molybdenum cofactor biosynthesis protein MoaE [Candidatus Oleimmundimicrobium sp.]MDO8886547.1 molybdenum cofactor biosynthesis protein MoaE [Candidatus Oleimmundimicrobium sp.]